MLIKYKDAAYNNKIEDLRNNGYTVDFVELDYDDFVTEEGNPVPFIELQLPNGGKAIKITRQLWLGPIILKTKIIRTCLQISIALTAVCLFPAASQFWTATQL